MKLKKIFGMLLILSVLITLTACGSNPSGNTGNNNGNGAESTNYTDSSGSNNESESAKDDGSSSKELIAGEHFASDLVLVADPTLKGDAALLFKGKTLELGADGAYYLDLGFVGTEKGTYKIAADNSLDVEAESSHTYTYEVKNGTVKVTINTNGEGVLVVDFYSDYEAFIAE